MGVECGSSGPKNNSSLLMVGDTLEGQAALLFWSPRNWGEPPLLWQPGECSWCGRGKGSRGEGPQFTKYHITSHLYPTEYPVYAPPRELIPEVTSNGF